MPIKGSKPDKSGLLILRDGSHGLAFREVAEKIKNPCISQIPPHGCGGTSPTPTDRRSVKCRARGEPREGGAVLPLVKMMWRNIPDTHRQEVCEVSGAGRATRGRRGPPSRENDVAGFIK